MRKGLDVGSSLQPATFYSLDVGSNLVKYFLKIFLMTIIYDYIYIYNYIFDSKPHNDITTFGFDGMV